MKLATTIALFALMATFANAQAQAQDEKPTPQLPDWVIGLAQLGDLYQQWCEDQGAEYKRDANHQLAGGGQWKCYLEVPEREKRRS